MELSEDEVIINLKYLKAKLFDMVVNAARNNEDSTLLNYEILLLYRTLKTIEKVGVKCE